MLSTIAFPLLAVSFLIVNDVDSSKFGIGGAHRHALLPSSLHRAPLVPNSSSRNESTFLLKLRGGDDQGNNDGGYYESEGNRDYEYDDRRRTSDDRNDRRGRSNDYQYGSYDDKRAPSQKYGDDRTGEYSSDRYKNDEKYYEQDYHDADARGASLPKMPAIMKTGNKKIGMVLLGAGGVFTLLGISLFFNKSLLRLGNLLVIAGVPMTIGPGRTAGYFFQPKKSRATACLAFGIFLVFVGWPIFGMVLEVFGILNLFGNMFPVLMVLLKQMPVVGTLLGKGNGGKRSSRSSQRSDTYDRDDKYYNDDLDQSDSANRYY